MKALFLSCTLKRSPETSNGEILATVLREAFEAEGVETETIRLVDLDIHPGVTSDEGDGDEWPRVHEALLGPRSSSSSPRPGSGAPRASPSG